MIQIVYLTIIIFNFSSVTPATPAVSLPETVSLPKEDFLKMMSMMKELTKFKAEYGNISIN